MALQDLTPQLRTRLSRVERTVGLFVTIATLLLLAGFVYYVYHTAMRKGWFDTKIVYETGLNNAAGLKPGDTVKLMGFDVGNLTEVIPNEPDAYYGVTVRFNIREPNYGYIWTDSQVRVAPADFLGNRYIEVLKGREGTPTVHENNKDAFVLDPDKFNKKKVSLFKQIFSEIFEDVRKENPTYNQHALYTEATNEVLVVLNQRLNEVIEAAPLDFYIPRAESEPFWIDPIESPALTERLETIVNTVENALPNILNLTNQLTDVFTNATEATSQLSSLLAESRPIVTNLTHITENLREPKGALGEWLLPTNISLQLESTLKSADEALRTADQTLATADKTLANTDTNLTTLVSNLNSSLENLANLTSNLNAQVQANTNILSAISSAIVNTDDLVQGLKRHWLLRSAFRTKRTDSDRETREEPAGTMDDPRPSHPGTRR
ncbi:MAG: MCE family protein [Verrucomicrobia bacterium]|nr:MCE family protein [Verrucomicrobiota bacterium]